MSDITNLRNINGGLTGSDIAAAKHLEHLSSQKIKGWFSPRLTHESSAKGTKLTVSRWPIGRFIVKYFWPFGGNMRKNDPAARKTIADQVSKYYGVQDKISVSSAHDLRKVLAAAKKANRQKVDKLLNSLEGKYPLVEKELAAEVRNSSIYRLGLNPDGLAASVDAEALERTNAYARIKRIDQQANDQFKLIGNELRTRDFSGREVIAKLSTIPKIKALFQGWNGNEMNLTVGQHTQGVLDQFEDQKSHYQLNLVNEQLQSLPGFENFDAERFMKVFLALHDIGKSIGEHTSEQHEYTVPILCESMHQMGFSEGEIRLAVALVRHNFVGDLQLGGRRRGADEELSRAAAFAEMVMEVADEAEIPREAFLQLQLLFYISDCSSYPSIRNKMKKDTSGKLAFNEAVTLKPKTGKAYQPVDRVKLFAECYEKLISQKRVDPGAFRRRQDISKMHPWTKLD